jgi:hypothetical protein
MEFGLCNTPSTYSIVMNLVLRGLPWKQFWLSLMINWFWANASRIIETTKLHYLETIQKRLTPTCTKEVERFCGFAHYHRNFIRDYAKISVQLYAVTGKNKFQ